MQFIELLSVGIGGILGAVSRFLITHIVKNKWQKSVSFGTFLINIMGSFLMGFSLIYLPINSIEKFFVCTGFISSFTTFSTFISEIHELHTKRQYFQNIMYIILTIIIGFVAFLIGISINSS